MPHLSPTESCTPAPPPTRAAEEHEPVAVSEPSVRAWPVRPVRDAYERLRRHARPAYDRHSLANELNNTLGSSGIKAQLDLLPRHLQARRVVCCKVGPTNNTWRAIEGKLDRR